MSKINIQLMCLVIWGSKPRDWKYDWKYENIKNADQSE